MEIIQTKINQILLMKFDEIPLKKLIQRNFLQGLTELFDLQEANVAHSPEGVLLIVGERGSYHSNGNNFPIDRLILEERRIQLVGIEGTSNEANNLMVSLKEYLSEVSGVSKPRFLKPVVKAEDSEIIARLEFPYHKLIAPAFLDFVNSEMVDRSSSDIADAELKLNQLAFSVNYQVMDKSFNDYRISLSRKEFRLEPRKGYPLSDQVYYSKAPLDTDTHITILTELEKVLS